MENKNQPLEKPKMHGRTKILISALCLITAAAISVTIWALFFRQTKPVIAPDYAPQQVEHNAKPADESDGEELEQPSGGGAVSLIYSNKVSLSLASKEATLMFQNPKKSNQDMKLEILLDTKTIVSSGRLEPGYKVEKLSKVDTGKLSQGTYEGKFIVSYYNADSGEKAIVSYYNADSGEKAIVNTEIPIIITVTN